ncbi:UDP-glucuronosyltransferase 2B7-like, partial [Oppia nitens]|uniref:UDP-glucuronosyltransferase 2B7-like n=1 Tax=Oppia nitens TaxID=1686743 RepID=UPI0023DB892B
MLTVLFVPLDGLGHINACHGLADSLREAGHWCVFAVDDFFVDQLTKYGFAVQSLTANVDKINDGVSLTQLQPPPMTEDKMRAKRENNFVARNAQVFKECPLNVAKTYVGLFDELCDVLMARDQIYKRIVADVKPDVIVVDSYINSPVLTTNSGIPWVWLYSAAPLMILNSNLSSDQLPPAWLGLPTNDTNDWPKHRENLDKVFEKLYHKCNKWYQSYGAALTPVTSNTTNTCIHPVSSYLNIYMTPEELDYREVQPLPENWRRIDCIVRTTGDTFDIPAKLRDRPGRLVYLSMGSLGCSHIELMTRLTNILGKSRHKFIVTKGPLHYKYDLPDNMWGNESLPQLAILPLVDLVITHGGNNTVTECCYYGKPMLVMPLFADQFDNAQRVQESGLGLRCNPFECSDEELVQSVDKLADDSTLADRMRRIGDRIRRSNDREMIVKIIE